MASWISMPVGGGVRMGTSWGRRRGDGDGGVGLMLGLLVVAAIISIFLPLWMVYRGIAAAVKRRWGVAVIWGILACATTVVELYGWAEFFAATARNDSPASVPAPVPERDWDKPAPRAAPVESPLPAPPFVIPPANPAPRAEVSCAEVRRQLFASLDEVRRAHERCDGGRR